MTIESLAESFREAKAKAGHPARIKYSKKLKDAAIEYFKANPSLTPSRMASMIGISTSCADIDAVVGHQIVHNCLKVWRAREIDQTGKWVLAGDKV